MDVHAQWKDALHSLRLDREVALQDLRQENVFVWERLHRLSLFPLKLETSSMLLYLKRIISSNVYTDCESEPDFLVFYNFLISK